MRVCGVITLCLLLAGCTLAAPGGSDGPAPSANPITGDAITVTPLDAAPVAAAATPAAAKADAAAKPAEAAAAAPAEPAAAEATKAPAAEATATEPAPTEATKPEDLPPPMSPQEAACRKKGGQWATAGQSGAKACVRPTRDGGKRCTRESQCEGACLARSNSCAPMTPLFGCNDILQDNGVMVTLCID